MFHYKTPKYREPTFSDFVFTDFWCDAKRNVFPVEFAETAGMCQVRPTGKKSANYLQANRYLWTNTMTSKMAGRVLSARKRHQNHYKPDPPLDPSSESIAPVVPPAKRTRSATAASYAAGPTSASATSDPTPSTGAGQDDGPIFKGLTFCKLKCCALFIIF